MTPYPRLSSRRPLAYWYLVEQLERHSSGGGIDYSFGGVEGIFDDGAGDEGSFAGVSDGILTLFAPVDGRIVLPGTTTQGLTSFLSVEAGFSANGALLLMAFDSNGVLIASVANGLPLGPHARTTMTIDRLGVYDIASFQVVTLAVNNFGVQQVSIEDPLASSIVPEPASFTIFCLASFLGIGGALSRRKGQLR